MILRKHIVGAWHTLKGARAMPLLTLWKILEFKDGI